MAGVEMEYDMDGGYRGKIHIVPELPVGKHAAHLEWVLEAQRDYARFMDAMAKKAPAGTTFRYRHRGLGWRFFRSVERRTPSAYATQWEVGYNVSGSLLLSPVAVRDTLFHEIFHLNDQEHTDWSRRVLGEVVDGIIAKCGTKVRCLAPFAPMPTVVVGGTFYAFQPGNGDNANEYGAELATRWFQEQRAALRGDKHPAGRFKCLTAENGKAWQAFTDEFFGGVDLVPACRPR